MKKFLDPVKRPRITDFQPAWIGTFLRDFINAIK